MQTGDDILISIIIPVKNGDIWLDRLFRKLMEQTLIGRTEIIVIDSGSTDRSLEIIRQYPVRLIQIPSHEFNHGDTRNLGAREAKGKFVVMTVQDAVPASDVWLECFVEGFTDETVAGVCGQQIVPHEQDKNPMLWFRPMSEHTRRFYRFDDPAEFLRLSPEEQRQKAGWDNVTSAYRRDLLLQHPFERIEFAEDISWAKQMLLKGYTLGHVDEAMTYHYHHHLPEFILPRYFAVYYFEYKIFGLRPRLSQSLFKSALITIKILVKERKLSWPAKFKWFVFNMRYWLGVKAAINKFNAALDKGGEELDILYREICKKPPQAVKY